MEFTLNDLYRGDNTSLKRANKNTVKLVNANVVLHALAALEKRLPNCKFRAYEVANELGRSQFSMLLIT